MSMDRTQVASVEQARPLALQRVRGPLSSLEHLVMAHAAGRQVARVDECERCPGAGVLLGVIVFPLDADCAVKADAIQLDHDLLDAVSVAVAAGGHKVPAVQSVSHGPVAAEQTGAGVFADYLHALDVSAID